MNMIKNSKIIPESFCSISGEVFKKLPKKDLPFCLHRMNPSNGKFTQITVPGKILVTNEKQSILKDCTRGLIFIKCTDICCSKEFFADHLTTVLLEICDAIPDEDLVAILLQGLNQSARKVYEDSFKLHIKDFHSTLCSVSEVLHEKPALLEKMIPQLHKEHSLVNKSMSTGLIGAAVILLGRDVKPDIKVFNDAFCALMLCDIGLCSLPEFVLGKEFCLTRDEQKRIKQHPISSLEILSVAEIFSKPSLRAILEHHERMDGSGYPRGVTNEKLSWLGKLCGAVDSFVAMTMQRPGKKRMPTVKALKVLYSESTKYDPNIIYALEKVIYR